MLDVFIKKGETPLNSFNYIKTQCKKKCGFCNDCKFWGSTNIYNSLELSLNYCRKFCFVNKNCLGYQIIEEGSNKYKCVNFYPTQNENRTLINSAKYIKKNYTFYKDNLKKETFKTNVLNFCQLNKNNISFDMIPPVKKYDNCSWLPWGKTKQACKDRCNVWSKSQDTDAYICSPEQCDKLCENCDNKESCQWLDEDIKNTDVETSYNLQCIPGISNIVVNFKNNYNFSPKYFMIQYFKTRNPENGIKLVQVNTEKSKKIYTKILNNLDNNQEYSISVYPVFDNSPDNNKYMSEIIKVVPNNHIIVPKKISTM